MNIKIGDVLTVTTAGGNRAGHYFDIGDMVEVVFITSETTPIYMVRLVDQPERATQWLYAEDLA